MRLRAQLEIAGSVCLRQFGVQGRPFGAALAALEAEAELHAACATLARLAVDGHAAGVHFLIAEPGGAVVHHLEVVVARQARDAIGARDAHLVFGFGVIRLQLLERERPIQQIRSLEVAVERPGLKFMLLEAQRSAGPVRACTSNRLADPGREFRKILGNAPASGGRALVEPSQLAEGLPFIIDEAGIRLLAACFQHDDLDAFLAQLVGQRAAAGARTDDHDDRVIAEIKRCHTCLLYCAPACRRHFCLAPVNGLGSASST